jgi:methylenetetrahydrofolate dehydrogenase (NADP+)/methenyltetrahydrofolate cyclohydrolase
VLECILDNAPEVRGMEAVVVGHSETVGKPVALLLMERLATVTVCHVETRDLFSHTRRAELLVVAAGKPHLIPHDAVKQDAIVIDVGINEIEKDGRSQVVGDVDTDAVKPRVSLITPVPGGVGPVTVGILLRNTVRAAASQSPLAI